MNREQLQLATQAMRLQVATTTQEVLDLRRGGLHEALAGWALTRDDYKDLDELRKEIYELLETLSKSVLPEMMVENGVKTVTLENVGRRFTKSTKLSCSMIDKDKGIEWLNENGGNALPQLTVNGQTLSSFAKARIENEGLDMPEDIFKVSTVANISATKV